MIRRAGEGQAERNVRVVDEVDKYFAPDFVQYSPYAPAGGRETVDTGPIIQLATP